MTDLALRLRTMLAWGLDDRQPIGLAVSGGGDSLAMLHLAAEAGLNAAVATVNHGLRDAAAAEAAMVADQARALGLAHVTLHWDGPAAKGNLQDAARLARRRLLAAWARDRGLRGVALAHTTDDLAETFLMRLARGAGVDGLSAMAPIFDVGGVPFLRPLLQASRADLRRYLADKGVAWAEDPTNTDPHYDRTRARAALAALGPLGLTAPRLAEVAGHLGQARDALQAATDDLLCRHVTVMGQGLALTIAPALLLAPAETLRRAVVAMIQWLAPSAYAPRGAQVAGLVARLQAGQDAQLQGARFVHAKGQLWACRDAAAVDQGAMPPGALFDGLWTVEGPFAAGMVLRPLGPDGVLHCPDWRAAGLPRAAMLTAPSVWLDGQLVSAPLAGLSAGFRTICHRKPHPLT